MNPVKKAQFTITVSKSSITVKSATMWHRWATMAYDTSIGQGVLNTSSSMDESIYKSDDENQDEQEIINAVKALYPLYHDEFQQNCYCEEFAKDY